MKDDPRIQSYPWYFADWFHSETRAAYNLEERGLYRELLDLCWFKGSLPNDPEMLQGMVAIRGETHVPFSELLQKILKQFTLGEDGRWHHSKIDEKREGIISLKNRRRKWAVLGGQARAEQLKGAKKGTHKANHKASHEATLMRTSSPTPTPTLDGSSSSFLVSNSDNHTTLPSFPPSAEKTEGRKEGMRGLKKTSKTLRTIYPATQDDFVLKLAALADEAAATVSDPKFPMTDQLLADAVEQSHKDCAEYQYGAGLFLKTVPRCIAHWMSEGRGEPVPRKPVTGTRTGRMVDEVAARMKAARLAKEVGK